MSIGLIRAMFGLFRAIESRVAQSLVYAVLVGQSSPCSIYP